MNWKDLFPKENRYFETENGILYCGDCLEIMKKFPEESIDLVVTSPPYNVGVDYDVWNDKLSVEAYFSFVEEFLTLFKLLLRKDGRFAINIPYDSNMKHVKKQTRISLLCEYYALIKKVGLRYFTIVDLVEGQPHRVKYTAWGSWMSASAPYIYNPKECILIGYKENWKKKKKGRTTIDKDLFIEAVSGMWKYKAETRQITKANFSKDIPYKAICILSYENDIILDPFAGAGTTCVVAERLKRRWIGIEISENYCSLAKQRILKEFP
jgi:site-specific DNA-methyltransferase (adenine-specific)